MTTDWNIRDEWFNLLHRWYLVALAFMVGALLGWALAFIVPSPYRAEAELYIAYNGDGIYRNPDDYKNWQLGELEIYIYSDEMLETALQELRQVDAYWNDIDTAGFRPALHTYWRNAGKWRLVVEWNDPLRAEQAALAWSEAVIRNSATAIDHGREAQILADRIRAFTTEEVSISAGSARLGSITTALNEWQTASAQAGTAQPLAVLERWRLQSLAAGLADVSPAAVLLLNDFPTDDAGRAEFETWASMALETIGVEKESLLARDADLKTRRDTLTRDWEQASLASRNLTTDLTVERLANIVPEGEPVRPSGQMALTGGVLAVLLLGLWGLAVVRKARR